MEKPYFPLDEIILISLLVPLRLTVRVYSPGLRVESLNRNVPSSVSLSLFDVSSLGGGEGALISAHHTLINAHLQRLRQLQFQRHYFSCYIIIQHHKPKSVLSQLTVKSTLFSVHHNNALISAHLDMFPQYQPCFSSGSEFLERVGVVCVGAGGANTESVVS